MRGISVGLAAVAAALAALSSASAQEAAADWTAQAHVPAYVCVRDFYIDPLRGAVIASGDQAHPWRTLQDADGATAGGRPVLRGGDCVNLAPGRYELTQGVRLNHGGERNDPKGWVVYRAERPGTAHLVAAARTIYGMIDIKTAYVVLDGLELDGADATAKGEGVAVSGEATHHHIVIEHCRIHGFGGGGVQVNDSEFFWVVGNEIWANAATNTYQESGISTYQPRAAEGVAPSPADEIPFHIVILGNVSRDNRETYPCAKAGCHTDGNGVIVDKTRNVDRPGGTPYAGRVLVADNLVFGNGGGGIHLYLSEHVTAAGNVAADNHLDLDNDGTWRGELSNADSEDVQWIGNVALAKQGPGVLAHNSAVLVASSDGRPAGRNVSWRGNTTCGGDPSVYARAPGLDAKSNRLDAHPEICRKLIEARRSGAIAAPSPDR